MSHPLLARLVEDAIVTPLAPGGVEAFVSRADPGLRVLFLAGDPDKKPETADVAVVLRELVKQYPGAFEVGLVPQDAEADAMKLTGTFALPSLVFCAGGRPVETIAKIQDWSIYAEALPRLIASSGAEVAA